MADTDQSREEGTAPNIMTRKFKKISVFVCEHATDMSTIGHGAQQSTMAKNKSIALCADELKKEHAGK